MFNRNNIREFLGLIELSNALSREHAVKICSNGSFVLSDDVFGEKRYIPGELIKSLKCPDNLKFVSIFHTHVRGEPIPSPDDIIFSSHLDHDFFCIGGSNKYKEIKCFSIPEESKKASKEFIKLSESLYNKAKEYMGIDLNKASICDMLEKLRDIDEEKRKEIKETYYKRIKAKKLAMRSFSKKSNTCSLIKV